MKRFKLTIGWQIMIGLVLGIILGIIFYQNKTAITTMSNIGTMFINLIQMIVLPIVLSCLTVGIASMGDIKKLGRIGGKTILYFEIMTTIAIALGLLVANLAHPGDFINIHALKGEDISKYVSTANAAKESGGWGTVMNLIPTNIFKSLSDGAMMQVIVFSVFFGLGTAAIGEKGKIIVDFLNSVSEVMFKVTNWVMSLAPIGVCALIGATLAQMGVSALAPLSYFVFLAYATMIVFILVFMGLAAKLFGFSLKNLLFVIKDEIVLAFSTASSEATLPRLIDKMQRFGVDKSIVSFVIPTGYTFNLDGSAIYQSLAVIFMAQAYHIHLSIGQQVMVLLVLVVTSKGMAGVPGASFVVLLATVSTVGIPVNGLAFIAGIDRLVDMGRTAVNVVGNSLATVIIGKSEKVFNSEQSRQYVQEFLPNAK
ncbi:cation:dicarboxylase symporter family transporter [Nicoliella spurrieriana]|uniref:Cation:dicarboxylase symporter family transporter n=1 Tax=Nicoliella spurrieriana TaxID=2925830 RepID=A0A976RSR7_9LACO|nr:cation:dicarboxylase symporter family transporter [Nicoliella spurrieriana]UQS87183.1 cation:dicarboxylase symporter family transporter [Nicoliella spurrieriana]